MLTLVITKLKKNEDYKEQLRDARIMYNDHWVEPYIREETLSVVITEEQFEAIRKAVLEAF